MLLAPLAQDRDTQEVDREKIPWEQRPLGEKPRGLAWGLSCSLVKRWLVRQAGGGTSYAAAQVLCQIGALPFFSPAWPVKRSAFDIALALNVRVRRRAINVLAPHRLNIVGEVWTH